MIKKGKIVILSVCIISVITCIALILLNHMDANSILDINAYTYISVIATLIGICATIIVGFQIAHFIELRNLKEQIDELNRLRVDIDHKSAELKKNIAFVKVGISSVFRIFYHRFKDDPLAPVACIIAIIAYDTTNKDQASTTLLSNYRKLYKMLNQQGYNIRFAKKYLDDLKNIDITKDLKDYQEICRLHYNIINILEKSK